MLASTIGYFRMQLTIYDDIDAQKHAYGALAIKAASNMQDFPSIQAHNMTCAFTGGFVAPWIEVGDTMSHMEGVNAPG